MINVPVSDSFFRWVLLAIFVPGISSAMYHRVRAARAGDKLDRRQEGLFILITLRVVGVIMFGTVFFWMARPSSFSWARIDLPDAARWAGGVLLALAMAWVWWVMHALGSNLTDTVVTRARHTLVTGGPYRWVRNPLYTGVLAVGVALTLLTARWFYVIVCTAMFLILAVRTKKEEENLIARFGDDYRRYMAATGRFFPRAAA
ncbi:MAG: methyltransferase family protein [Bryobacteraceae bacterium]